MHNQGLLNKKVMQTNNVHTKTFLWPNNQWGQIKQNHEHCYVRSTVNDICMHNLSNKVTQTNT